MSKRKAAARPIFYKRQDGVDIEPTDASEWVKWCEETRGGKEYVIGSGNAEVSVQTIFTGHDLGIGDEPLLFVTIITGSEYHGHAWHSSTVEQAELRHAQACERIGFELPPRLRITSED